MRPTDAELYQLAESVGQSLTRHGQMLASAESCTGGWLGMIITAVPGSSAWFERGFITYSNQAKQDLLGVQAATLDSSGAVSEATVLENGAWRLVAQRGGYCAGDFRYRRPRRRHAKKTRRHCLYRLGAA